MVSDALHSDPRMKSLTVRGEISGFKHHIASGHWYFNLKDENACVACVMFHQNNSRASFRPQDGDRVLISGYVDVFPRDGKYQLYALTVRRAGLGDLYLRFEELKRKMRAEGLFDPARKRVLPMLPKKVAVVTSESGAALRDILNVSGNRCPFVPVVVIPAVVQGDQGAPSICDGIRRANEIPDVDVIIVARGGGSVEDLWCFNEESVARTVADSRIPVVSGVGHEIDFTLCDYAADVRASTPSNAAEIVFPDRAELLERTMLLRTALKKEMTGRVDCEILRLLGVRKEMERLSPEKRLSDLLHRARIAGNELNSSMRNKMIAVQNQLLSVRRELDWRTDRALAENAAALSRVFAGLHAVSPMSVLDRGYAIVLSETGHVLTSAKEAATQSAMKISFRDGTLRVKREETDHE